MLERRRLLALTTPHFSDYWHDDNTMAAVRALALAALAATASGSSATYFSPLFFELQPEETRCIYAEYKVPRNEVKALQAEFFVESGGHLDVEVRVVGPFPPSTEGVPAARGGAAPPVVYEGQVQLEEMTSADEFADSFVVDFEAKGAAAPSVYGACVSNVHAGRATKLVQVDLRETHRTAGAQEGKKFAADGSATPADASNGVLAMSIKRLKAKLREVGDQQSKERHRLAIHTNLNHSASKRMAWGSCIETLCFVAVSAFQLGMIRMWFMGRGGGRGKASQWA